MHFYTLLGHFQNVLINIGPLIKIPLQEVGSGFQMHFLKIQRSVKRTQGTSIGAPNMS